jgi:uncharacterized glyoxalase superfamily protein PhnB
VITPVLSVRDAVRAVPFYERAFGSHEIYRNTYPAGRYCGDGRRSRRFRVADEAPEAANHTPQALSETM